MRKGTILVLAILMAALLVPQAGAQLFIGKTAIAVSYNNAWAGAAGERASTHTFTAEKTSVSVAPEEEPEMAVGTNSRGSYGSRYSKDPVSTTASTQGVAVASAKGCIAESSATSLGISAATNEIDVYDL